MTEIYQVKVSDGTSLYFDNRTEAEFYANDTVKCGLSVVTRPIPLPETAKEFVQFMERIEGEIRPLKLAALKIAS